jgi:choline dehydrogenase-like flavoprotein
MKVAVIGSGPSGWAVFEELKDMGHDVTIIDAGLEEKDKSDNSIDKDSMKTNKKLYFGSDLPYRDFPFGPIHRKSKVNPISSFSQGGLSLVWGATMLPYSSSDTKNWPFPISDLTPFFSKLSKLIPISGVKGDVGENSEAFVSRRSIFPSQRIVRMLEKYNSKSYKKNIIGISKLAVETGALDKPGCYYCNKCMTGCPSNYIWSSKGKFVENKIINIRVLEIKESNDAVFVSGVNKHGEEVRDLCFEKVYLASGSVESFRILANSDLVQKEVTLQDSATFFLPIFSSRKLGKPKLSSFGLSQLFIKILGSANSHPSQYQIYEYSEDILRRAREANFMGRIIPKSILRIILKKMLIAIGYLDGKQSPSIQMRLASDGSVELSLFNSGVTLNQRNRFIKKSILDLKNELTSLGAFPISFLSVISKPGEGVHSGGWLQMGKGSNLLGVPLGCSNIHVVDSSVLPSIAAGPITFTVMANAMRIARQSQC